MTCGFNPLFAGLTLKVDGKEVYAGSVHSFQSLFAGLTLKGPCAAVPRRGSVCFNPLFAGLTLKVRQPRLAYLLRLGFQSPICGADAQSWKDVVIRFMAKRVSIPYLRG